MVGSDDKFEEFVSETVTFGKYRGQHKSASSADVMVINLGNAVTLGIDVAPVYSEVMHSNWDKFPAGVVSGVDKRGLAFLAATYGDEDQTEIKPSYREAIRPEITYMMVVSAGPASKDSITVQQETGDREKAEAMFLTRLKFPVLVNSIEDDDPRLRQ